MPRSPRSRWPDARAGADPPASRPNRPNRKILRTGLHKLWRPVFTVRPGRSVRRWGCCRLPRRRAGPLFADGPADLLRAPGAHAGTQAVALPVFKLVGDEIRDGQKVQQQIARDEPLVPGKPHLVLPQNSSTAGRGRSPGGAFYVDEREGVERLDAELALVRVQPLADGFGQRLMVAARGLELDDKRRGGLEQGQHLVRRSGSARPCPRAGAASAPPASDPRSAIYIRVAPQIRNRGRRRACHPSAGARPAPRRSRARWPGGRRGGSFRG